VAGRDAGREHRRISVLEVRAETAAVEEGSASAYGFAVDGTRHHVAGSKLCVRVHCAHEALAAGVDEESAFAAQRFRGERRRIAADIDSSRVELHELGVGDDRAGARRDGNALTSRFARVGGDGVELACTAGGEHDGARRQNEAISERVD